MKKLTQLASGLAIWGYASLALASQDTGTYEWDKFLDWLVGELKSNVALGIGLLVIIACGLLFAFGDFHGGAKKGLFAGVGIGVTLSATSILSDAFGTGALIPHATSLVIHLSHLRGLHG